nr:SusD/RagB family nutrient-binding outer membrane lipoprotein [Parabacteroides goldsteinii]
MKKIMNYKYIAAIFLLAGAGLFSSCQDKFADINSDPTKVTNPNIRFLFTQFETAFQPADYSQWFYGFESMSIWAQATTSRGGNDNKINIVSGSGCGYQVNEALRYANEIKHQISLLDGEEKDKYEYIQYLCNPILVFLSMEDADMYGSRQYSEAEMVRYGGTLTPKYDTQEELFDLWLQQLNETLTYLAEKKPTDILSSQDFLYKGDLSKWAKFANSLKLKIATRLINKDKARALQIVNEAVNNAAGLVLTREDDIVINKGKRNNNFNNNLDGLGAGSQQLINFMVENRDPRLFSIFMKNSYNANVIQGFFDQERAIPSYIEKNVEYKTENGKKVFTGWKAPGEPWVRYYGTPCQVDLNKNPEFDEYFDPNGVLFCLYDEQGVKKTYTPIAYRNKESVKGGFTYTYPDVPGVTPVEDKEPYGWYGLYFSAGETNLLLAEFKLLGANLPKSAQEYLTTGIEQSVRSYDYIAGQNHLPYYDKPYSNDPFDKSIKLTEEQVSEMLSKDAYKLTGNLREDLEKVYIQQFIHYMMLPMDMFVTARRSGIPMKDSKILPRVQFDPVLGESFVIPRRFPVSAPDKADLLFDITIAAYEAQGFTYSGEQYNTPSTLSKERVWYDKEAPELGAGPKL